MILTVENGCFSYPGKEREVLRDISFEVRPGEVMAVLGPNGAGKTTLLKCMMGLMKWSSGKSCLDGRDINGIPAGELWSAISYVPQASGISSQYTAEEMIMLGRSSFIRPFSLPGRNDMLKVEETMERLGITRLRKTKCSEMSGGELQMVLIARAVVSEPEILVLDEPESNLDFRNQLVILDTITELSKQGTACIFNTHYPAHALRRADLTMLMGSDGSRYFGKTREILTENSISKVFGVKAVIGDIESSMNIYQDIIPLSREYSGPEPDEKGGPDQVAVATVSVIVSDDSKVMEINNILKSCGEYVIGRMGMPCRSAGIKIINVVIEAPLYIIQSLTDKLNLTDGISVKTTYSKQV